MAAKKTDQYIHDYLEQDKSAFKVEKIFHERLWQY